jgi:hypothetical protein
VSSIAGGTIRGAEKLEVQPITELDWSAGSILATVQVDLAGLLDISDTGDKELAGTIHNDGFTILEGGCQVTCSGATIENDASGIFSIGGGSQLFDDPGVPSTFTNAGVFRRVGGGPAANVAVIQVNFENINAGQVEINGSLVSEGGSFTQDGDQAKITIAANAALDVERLVLTGSIVQGPGTLAVTRTNPSTRPVTMTWTAAQLIDLPLFISSDASVVMDFTGLDGACLKDATVVNEGTMTYTAGSMDVTNTIINNGGTFVMDGGQVMRLTIATAGVFNNMPGAQFSAKQGLTVNVELIFNNAAAVT